MRIRSILGALVMVSLSVMPAWAVDLTPEEIKKIVDEAVEKVAGTEQEDSPEEPSKRKHNRTSPALSIIWDGP